MLKSPEWIELLSIMARNDVRYLVVGGYAVMRYGEPRFTKDLDLWIANDKENAQRVYQSLKAFGAPLEDLEAHDFSNPEYYYQMGRPPLRVDIMMSVTGLDFDPAWERRETVAIEGLGVPFLTRADLLVNKRALGRPQDLLDAEMLEKQK